MAIISNGLLDKMEFRFFKDQEHKTEEKPRFKVMYNPKDLVLKYDNAYSDVPQITFGPDNKFKHKLPRTATLTLTFDGTGASPSGINDKTDGNDINTRINAFVNKAYKINSDKHAPLYMVMVWGKVYFPCILTSASVTYKLFKPDGTPLRADLAITLTEDISPFEDARATNLLSPDLTKSYIVKEGDRLDALCFKIYEDSSLYREVAQVNNLTNPRKLTAGQTLVFPPIDKRN